MVSRTDEERAAALKESQAEHAANRKAYAEQPWTDMFKGSFDIVPGFVKRFIARFTGSTA